MPVIHRRALPKYPVGIVEVTEPGRYEILIDIDSFVLDAVRRLTDEEELPVGVQVITGKGEAFHRCSPCSCCRECACYGYRGHCSGCESYYKWRQEAETSLETYLAACADPEIWFVRSSSGIIHRVDCSSLKSTASLVQRELDGGCYHHYAYDVHCSTPLKKEDVKGTRRCRVCCPDITLPVS